MKRIAMLAATGLVSMLPNIASARPHFFFGFARPVPLVVPFLPPIPVAVVAPVVAAPVCAPAPEVVCAPAPVIVCAPAPVPVVYDYGYGYHRVWFDRGYGWHHHGR